MSVQKFRWQGTVLALVLVGGVYAYQLITGESLTAPDARPATSSSSQAERGERDRRSQPPGFSARSDTKVGTGDAAIEEAFRAERSGVMVESGGRVEKTLPDDNEGSRHQRFIVRLDSGRSLLVAHNIDLAKRVPLEEGDRVEFKGQYEWNDRGGVLHWTHHDPAGRHPGGWLEHEGRKYE